MKNTKIWIISLLSIAIICFSVAGILYYQRVKEQQQYEVRVQNTFDYLEMTYPEYSQDPNSFCHIVNWYFKDIAQLYKFDAVEERKTMELVAQKIVEKFPDEYSSYGWRKRDLTTGGVDYLMILYSKDGKTFSFCYFAVSEARWTAMHPDGYVEAPYLETNLTCQDDTQIINTTG